MGDCQLHLASEERLKHIEGHVKEITHLRDKIVLTEQSAKSAHSRLDNMEAQTEAIIRMSMSVENIASQIKEILGLLKEHDDRLDQLERAPGENILSYWKQFITAVIVAIAGLIVGFISK